MNNICDKNKAPTKIFQQDDLVMIPNHKREKGKSNKLPLKFRGPFQITCVLDNDKYEVSSIRGHADRAYRNIFPANHLKPWITMEELSVTNKISSTTDDSLSE